MTKTAIPSPAVAFVVDEGEETVTGARLFIAHDVNDPNCVGYGDSAEEAIEMLQEARTVIDEAVRAATPTYTMSDAPVMWDLVQASQGPYRTKAVA